MVDSRSNKSEGSFKINLQNGVANVNINNNIITNLKSPDHIVYNYYHSKVQLTTVTKEVLFMINENHSYNYIVIIEKEAINNRIANNLVISLIER